jgi:tetratricopeptide (TPR) repeat protein
MTAPGAFRQRAFAEWLPSCVLFVGFACLYAWSVDVHATNVPWHNFVFDADIDRVIADAQRGQGEVAFARHPLFALSFALPAAALSRLGVSLIASLRLVAALVGALGVVGARAIFDRITGDRTAAFLCSVLYGLTSTVWLLSSIPETFALNAAAIVGLFVMHDPSFARPRRDPGRFALFCVFSALAVGATVSNAIYVALVLAANARAAESSLRRRASSFAAGGLAVAAAFVALTLLQKVLLGARVVHGTGLVDPLGAARTDRFLDVTRALSLHDALAVARAFLVDNLIAPGVVVAVVREADAEPTMSGYTQMLQYGDWTAPTYLLAVAALGAFAVVAVARADRRRLLASQRVQLAVACIAVSLALFYFYRANGQPFIFSIQTVLPVTVLLAEAYACDGVATFPRWLGVAALGALGLNNATFVGAVRTALALPCHDRLPLVCVSWATDGVERRFAVGLPEYVASTEYLLDEGSVAASGGRFADAETFFRAALARRPDSLAAERGLAVCAWQLGRVDEAIERFGRVLERDPSDEDVRRVLERLTHRSGG